MLEAVAVPPLDHDGETVASGDRALGETQAEGCAETDADNDHQRAEHADQKASPRGVFQRPLPFRGCLPRWAGQSLADKCLGAG